MYFNAKECGLRIKAARKKMKLTQAEMADRLNVGLNHYGKVENGFNNPSLDMLIDIAAILEKSLDYIILGK